MLFIISTLVLLVLALYIIWCAYQDSCLYAILLFIFGPFLAWVYILFLWKADWPKKIIFLILYYIAAGSTMYFLYFNNPMFNPDLANEETTQSQDNNMPDNSAAQDAETYDPDFSTADE